jgi:hypothetical protein
VCKDLPAGIARGYSGVFDGGHVTPSVSLYAYDGDRLVL